MTSLTRENLEYANACKFKVFDPINDLKDTKNFAMTITSARRTGKSVFMKDVCHKLKDWYVETFVFSLTSQYQHDLFDYVNPDNVINSFDEVALTHIWNQQEGKIQKLEKAGVEKKDMPHVLILMDDLISDVRVKKSAILNKFYTAGRHICFAIIFITQYFKSIPPVLRTNVDAAVAFYIENYESRDAFAKQYLSTRNNQTGLFIFDRITKTKYTALVMLRTKITDNPEDYVRTYVARLKVPKFLMGAPDAHAYKYRPKLSYITHKNPYLVSPEVQDNLPRVKIPKAKGVRFYL